MRNTIFVRRSLIHGKGVFAKRDIGRREYIGSFRGRKTSRDGIHVLWLVDDHGQEEGLEVRNSMRYLNHSPAPNAEMDGVEVYALRRIGRGEEITIHYGEDWEDREKS